MLADGEENSYKCSLLVRKCFRQDEANFTVCWKTPTKRLKNISLVVIFLNIFLELKDTVYVLWCSEFHCDPWCVKESFWSYRISYLHILYATF